MSSQPDGLKAQTTTSPLGCEICDIRVFYQKAGGQKIKHTATIRLRPFVRAEAC